MTQSLSGKVAIVTGGAQGIGYAVTKKLVQEGARVLFADIDATAAQAVEQELGASAVASVGDLLAPGAPEGLVAQAVERFGAIDIVVNNAGFHWDSPLHKMSDAQWQAMLDIHMTVPFRILRAAGPHFVEAGQREAQAGSEVFRKVVNVSSLAGSFGNVGAANYSAAKALAKEWGPYKVNVNAVAFGTIQTHLGLPQGQHNRVTIGGNDVQLGVADKVLRAMGISEERKADELVESVYEPRVIKGIPLGRAGHISEAADTVYYLCSPLANYVTGQVLAASGGAGGGMS